MKKTAVFLALASIIVADHHVEAFGISPGARYQSLRRQLNGNRNAFLSISKQQDGARVTSCLQVSLSSPESYKQTSDDAGKEHNNCDEEAEIGPLEATVTKLSMMMYIASMCIALPVTLLPTALLYQSNLISKTQCEQTSLQTGEFCAGLLLQWMPFLNMRVIPHHEEKPEPTIWVCNHTSMLDTFILLAADEMLRGKNKRPIKTVYWKGLDENPVTKMLFHMCGFIPVQMAANGSGNPNDYDRSSFKSMLKMTKQAFQEGFDVLILPEGQLNPDPEQGLLPVFSGAFTLAKMSRRPIRMVALHGMHRLWSADDSVGMKVTARDVAARAYPPGKKFESGEEFVETFKAIVGHFGATGEDLPENELQEWLHGRACEELSQQRTGSNSWC